MDIDGLIEGHFSDELSSEEERALREALRRSPEHKRRYDARAELLRVLAASAPPRREQAALWAAIEGSLDAPREVPRRSEAVRSPTRRWFAWAPVLVAAVLVAGTIALVLRDEPPRDDRTYKGGGGDRAPVLRRVALEIYAIRRGDDGQFATPRPVAPGERVTLHDYIQCRYSSADPAFHHLYLGAIRAPTGASALVDEMRLYYPRPGAEAPLPIGASASMRTVGRSIRLGAHHRAGILVLVAIFTEKVQPRARVEDALRRLARGRSTPFASFSGKVALVRHRYQLVAAGSGGAGVAPTSGGASPGRVGEEDKRGGELSR